MTPTSIPTHIETTNQTLMSRGTMDRDITGLNLRNIFEGRVPLVFHRLNVLFNAPKMHIQLMQMLQKGS